MQQKLKQRLIGAATLITVAVIFIPMLLDNPGTPTVIVRDLALPPRPHDLDDAHLPSLDEEKLRSPPVLEPPPAAAEAVEAPATGTAPEPGAAPAAKADALKPESKPPDRRVAVEATESAPPPLSGPSPKPTAAKPSAHHERLGVTAWAIQLGSFSSEENAKTLEQRLKKQGFKAFVEKLYLRPGTVFRVRVGPELEEAKAKLLQARLEKEISLKGILVRYP